MTTSIIRLPRSVIVKSPGLLPMHYTVAELSRALDIAERTLRDWLAHGAPYMRDEGGHIWVNGKEFAKWVVSMRKPARKRKLRDDQAYCMHCRKVVELLTPETHPVRGKLTNTHGTCPLCGRNVNRGGRMASDPEHLFPRRTELKYE